jgi:DNA repair exonuclease SbcCD ATPase subunit
MEKDGLLAAGSHVLRDSTGLAVRRLRNDIYASYLPGARSVKQAEDVFDEYQNEKEVQQIESVQDSSDALKAVRERL